MPPSNRHHYALTTIWSGSEQGPVRDYRSYSRNHVIKITGKPPLPGSADPAFLGDTSRYNPEDLLLASLSACHMLWYLHLASDAGVEVCHYTDNATAVMETNTQGSGHFSRVILNPEVTILPGSSLETANALHSKANEMCFIAASVNFPISHNATATFAS